MTERAWKGTFEGNEECSKNWIVGQNISGKWVNESNGSIMLRCPNGVQIHWSSTKMTVWVSGKQKAKSNMERHLAITLPDADDGHDYPDFDRVD